MFAQAIYNHNAPLDKCIGFIDGTVRPMCRPSYFQRLTYNGHKRVHALKFQSVTTPDGLIVDMYGPIEGRRHDVFLLNESGLRGRLQEVAKGADGCSYYIYGDPAYGVEQHIISPYKGNNLTHNQNRFNAQMSSVRETVEYGFQRIVTLWAFLDFKKNLKLQKSPIGKLYLVAAILSNIHACFYGSQTASYFDIETPDPVEYMNS
jgi:hypothetical protein